MVAPPLIALLGTAEADRWQGAVSALGFPVLVTAEVPQLVSRAAELGVVLLPEGERAAWLAERIGAEPTLSEVPIVALLEDEGEEPTFAAEGRLRWPLAPEVGRLTLERFAVERQARACRARSGALLAGLTAAAEQLLEVPELERNLDGFVQTACQHLGAREGALLVLGKSDREVWVLASHDGVGGVPLPLDEPAALALIARIQAGQEALLEEPEGDGLLARAVGHEAPASLRCTLTVTVPIEGRPAGGLIVALEEGAPAAPEQMRAAARLLAILLGSALQNSTVWKRLREQTRPVNLERMESELRSRTLRRYREFFEGSSDGVIVVDGQARVVHINRAGAMMTGYAEGWLLGRPLAEIVAEHHREGLVEIVQQGTSGTLLQSFDLQIATTSGDVITVDVSTSTLMLDQRVLVLTFRDVSEARAIEDELTKTKEFLERLIASAVDAIVAADASTGIIILFNQGAARLFGHAPEDVVGRRSLSDLFPEEEYEELLRLLHSPQFGGEGRLEQRHVHARDAVGQHLPVSLSASTIYEEDREVAVVAILTDLREQLQIQERLAMAQEKLEVTEKQAVIAELAGTTAHELNQPLTSVMGYAELLIKKAGEDSPLAHPLRVILQEAGRMAEIVRKIGKITRYETKSYVGTTQILDLERSTEE